VEEGRGEEVIVKRRRSLPIPFSKGPARNVPAAPLPTLVPRTAESQPQQPAQFNAPQVTRQAFWLATSLRLVFDTVALRQRGFAPPLGANPSLVRGRRILPHTQGQVSAFSFLPYSL